MQHLLITYTDMFWHFNLCTLLFNIQSALFKYLITLVTGHLLPDWICFPNVKLHDYWRHLYLSLKRAVCSCFLDTIKNSINKEQLPVTTWIFYWIHSPACLSSHIPSFKKLLGTSCFTVFNQGNPLSVSTAFQGVLGTCSTFKNKLYTYIYIYLHTLFFTIFILQFYFE